MQSENMREIRKLTSRGTARFVSTVLPSTLCGLASWAASTMEECVYVTNPKPLDLHKIEFDYQKRVTGKIRFLHNSRTSIVKLMSYRQKKL